MATARPWEPPVPEIPLETLVVTADLRRLTQRANGENQREASTGCQLPPLLAALTRRTEDDTRLRQLRGLRLPTPPGQDFAEGVTLRPYPPLCCDAIRNTTEPEPLDVQELYRELSRSLPAERLQFHCEPLVEPAATAAALLPTGPRNTGEPPQHGVARHGQRQNTCLFDDYLQYIAATGSDFLHAIFHLRGGEEKPAGAPQPHREPAPAPVPLYEKGLWKPVLPEPAPTGLEQLQRRLHRLWAALGVPSWERLEMVVKYSANGALGQLPAALEAWERAASGILQREVLLAQLERLEERGSDPGRFFRGDPVSATRHAEEARSRGRLRAALARCEARLSVALRRLQDGFGDTVTFRGRPYAEKMRWDTVEMLYWLQQRRRAGALQAALGGPSWCHPPGPARAETPGCQ